MTFNEHVLQHEFIGSKAQIEYGSLDNKRIINGKIIFETKIFVSKKIAQIPVFYTPCNQE